MTKTKKIYRKHAAMVKTKPQWYRVFKHLAPVLLLAVIVAILTTPNMLGRKQPGFAETTSHSTPAVSPSNTSSAKPTPAPTTSIPKITISTNLPTGVTSKDWDLILVNRQYPLSQDLTFNKESVHGILVDSRIAKPLNDFIDAAAAAGYPTTLISGYRTIAQQETLFNGYIQEYEQQGMSKEEATARAEETSQPPGASEHATGLAVDLAGSDAAQEYPQLNTKMENFDSQKWLMSHCSEFGFILHFKSTQESEKKTGITYEPWHFRYVGVANAKYINSHNITLEDYIELLKSNGR